VQLSETKARFNVLKKIFGLSKLSPIYTFEVKTIREIAI